MHTRIPGRGPRLSPAARVLSACAGLGLALSACGGEERAEPRDAAPVAVETLEVELGVMPDLYEAVGTLRPRLRAKVASKVMATVESVAVEPGSAVEGGQRLARLDARDLRAEYDRARADYERFRALREKGAATAADLEVAQSRFRVADAALSYADIRAPFAGVVAAKLVEVGDMAVPGVALFEIEGTRAFRVESLVPERFAERVSIGTPAEVVVDATGEVCPGSVGEVVPTAHPTTRSVLVKVDVSCRQPLQSGGFARARLPVGERRAVAVPQAALRRSGQLDFVWVVRDGRAAMRLVTLGRASVDRVEVLSGLEPGERVVVEVGARLADGQAVVPRGPADAVAAPPGSE